MCRCRRLPPPRRPAAEPTAYAVKMALTRWVGRALPGREGDATLPASPAIPRRAAGLRRRERPRLESALRGRGLSWAVGPAAGPRPQRVRRGPVGPGGALAGAAIWPLVRALLLSCVHCGWKELLRRLGPWGLVEVSEVSSPSERASGLCYEL